MFQKVKNNLGLVVLAALGLGAVFVWLAVFELAAASGVEIDFFDVGQGSAVFIDAPGGNQVLIDGGPSSIILSKLGKAMPFLDRRLELVILTHPDSDHLNGLIEALKHYSVGMIMETGLADSSLEYQIWRKLIQEKKIPVVLARAGQLVKIADNLGLKILYPLASLENQSFKQTNKGSLVAKLFYGKNTFLLTGDVEEMTEQILLWSGVDLGADILQVGHHGSKSSTSQEFLEAVAPQIAVIQVGAKNKYGHPHQEVLERLAGNKILRTDLFGDIIFSCDLERCY